MLRYILLLACSWVIAYCPVAAQNKTLQTRSADTDVNSKLVQGVMVSADLFGLLGSGIFDNDFTSSEVGVQVNLKNRYFPVVEIGYGTTDETDDDNDVHYKVSAPFFRIGIDYNFNYKKDTPNVIFAGFRFGYSSFSYDVDGPDLTDPVWGGSVPFNYEGVNSNASWFELVAGLRTKIWKNFHMGWSVRYKRRLSVKESTNAEPWYIPGFGENGASLFGATYNIIYYIPWKK